MKRISCIFFLLLTFIGKSFAVDVPPPPIDIDISNSNFEIIDSTKFRIRQLIAPEYPGSYWVDFLWNVDQLLFEPTSVGEETSASSGKIKVAIVSKSGDYYSDPIAAMNDLATWCGTPSETNPCLVKILPGVYDIGTNTLQMKPYVDIEGSGETVTRIRGSGNAISQYIAVVEFADAEIRFLTVENTGGENYSVAISSGISLAAKITNVTIIASGGIINNYGFRSTYELLAPPSPGIKMTNVTINVSGDAVNYGVFKGGGYKLMMKNVTITTSGGEINYGAYIYGGTVIDGSTIKAETAIYNVASNVGVTNTLLDGSVSGPGTTKCAGVYDENYTFFANTCP